MNELTGILAVAAPSTASTALSRETHAMRVEFDAMMLEMLIKTSGLLNVLTESEDGATSLIGEMFAAPLARQLAQQVDLGFGSTMVRAAGHAYQGEGSND